MAMMPPFGAGVVLESFIGDWSDSLGNEVRVWDSGRGSIQVTLRRPDGTGKEIMLQVKKVGAEFQCGHYECVQQQSSSARVVWRDRRHADRITVWTRKLAAAGQHQASLAWATPALPPPGTPQPVATTPQFVVQPPALGMPQVVPPNARITPAGWMAPPMMPQQPFGAHLVPQHPQFGAVPGVGAASQFVSLPPPPPPRPTQTIELRPGHPQQPQLSLPQAPFNSAPGVRAAHASTAPTPPWAGRPLAVPPPPPAVVNISPQSISSAPQPNGANPTAADDWAHVLNVLAASSTQQDPASGSGAGAADAKAGGTPAPKSPGAASDATKGSTEPDDAEAGAERWSEVLQLLQRKPDDPAANAGSNETHTGTHPEAAATHAQTLGVHVPGADPNLPGGAPNAASAGNAIPNTQVNNLFNVFGYQQQASHEVASEELRAQVLRETLARLLQQKIGAPAPGGTEPKGVAPPSSVPAGSWAGGATDAANAVGPGAGDIPDWQRKTGVRGTPIGGSTPSVAGASAPMKVIGAEEAKVEGPLDKFIRIFGLDELASRCLQALEDDEAAFVIESCQGRLRYARNPSAVVMTSIKGVAAKVGRRYYGSRYNSELMKLLEQHNAGEMASQSNELQFFEGSPEPEGEQADEDAVADDPYGAVVDLEEIEEAANASDGNAAKRAGSKIEAFGAKKQKASAGDADDSLGVVQVLAGSPEPVSEEDDDADDDGLFFVDTGK